MLKEYPHSFKAMDLVAEHRLRALHASWAYIHKDEGACKAPLHHLVGLGKLMWVQHPDLHICWPAEDASKVYHFRVAATASAACRQLLQSSQHTDILTSLLWTASPLRRAVTLWVRTQQLCWHSTRQLPAFRHYVRPQASQAAALRSQASNGPASPSIAALGHDAGVDRGLGPRERSVAWQYNPASRLECALGI